MSFSLRCSRFLSQYTRHNFLPPFPSSIPRLSDSQLFVNTIYFPRLEPKYWYKIPLFYGQQQLIVNLSGPCITLTVLTVISSPPKELQKSGFIRLLLPFFSFVRQEFSRTVVSRVVNQKKSN